MPFQQRTNTSCYLAIPTHGFTVVLSVFRGTPPAKPLNCKSVSNRLGARNRSAWTHHTGGMPRHSCPSSVALRYRITTSSSVWVIERRCSSRPLLRRVDASIRLLLLDILKTSFSFCSQFSAFRYQVSLLFRFCMGNKKPCFHSGKQGCKIV